MNTSLGVMTTNAAADAERAFRESAPYGTRGITPIERSIVIELPKETLRQLEGLCVQGMGEYVSDAEDSITMIGMLITR